MRQFSQQGLSLIGGVIADRVGVRAPIVAGLLVRSAGFAWMAFADTPPELFGSAMLAGFGADEAVVVTRFGLAAGAAKPVFVDILYSVAALKPLTATLNGKVLDKAEPDPAWRQGLTRSVMGVRFPVRSVLAEPVVPLSVLMNLKPGDIIPITVTPDVPVMVGRDCLGAGTVGTANGRAAIRLTHLARIEGLNA